MSERQPRGDDEDATPAADRTPIACTAVVKRYDDEPDVCTIYDGGGTTPLRTTWLSAKEGSFVDLEDAR
ncbi:DUF7511 domain-containing protein [Natrialbaceae archaeon AArc-T1-2]|uniref:DUF7511 domain-containing protein n=1 Tax=Natrialbaceae archaeon AArc-T1-2 TaxID=3053904 RepID=UPI00255B3A5B|nr:hypothetical protein [Natrialbaceae archaeon AArc-T1-2]WIV66839.1 hypothetical protein QQ977_14260 [Natrialbaceae archaeon AArc-T1-2]